MERSRIASAERCGSKTLQVNELAARADALCRLWQTRCLRGTLSSRVSGTHLAARPAVEHSETPSGKILAVTDTNGPKVHTQFLYHRAHGPRQIHACRPPAGNDRRTDAARDARAGAGLDGSGARARHHHQGQEHSPALQGEGWKHL